MKYFREFGIILAVSFLGELLKFCLPLPIPASIYGLVIMLILLITKKVKLQAVKKTGNFLIEIMPLMFIPAGVGLMVSMGELRSIWFPFIIIVVVTTIAVMAVTGRITQKLLLLRERKR